MRILASLNNKKKNKTKIEKMSKKVKNEQILQDKKISEVLKHNGATVIASQNTYAYTFFTSLADFNDTLSLKSGLCCNTGSIDESPYCENTDLINKLKNISV